MLALLEAFLKIALRRLGPEDLPDSRFLLILVGVIYAVMQVLVALPVFGPGPAILLTAVLDVVILCGCLWALLRITGYPERYGRTLTAIFGTGALLTLLIVPLNLWIEAAATPERPALLPSAGIIAVVIWSVIVNGHIIARAISAQFAMGLAVAVSYFLLNYLVIIRFGPVPS
jgi:hypothetical protein